MSLEVMRAFSQLRPLTRSDPSLFTSYLDAAAAGTSSAEITAYVFRSSFTIHVFFGSALRMRVTTFVVRVAPLPSGIGIAVSLRAPAAEIQVVALVLPFPPFPSGKPERV